MVWSRRGRSSVGGLVRMFGRLALLALLCGRITTAVLRDATHWDEVVTKLGYEHLRRHDLRHTGLTWMADAGIPVRVQRQIAGHGSLVTTQRYLHPDAQSITDAVTGLSAHLSARWSPKPAITTRRQAPASSSTPTARSRTAPNDADLLFELVGVTSPPGVRP